YLQGDLSRGLLVTIVTTIVATAAAVTWAVVPAVMRVSGSRPFVWLSKTYIELFRGTPILVQVFTVFFGLSVLGFLIDPWPAAVLVFTLNAGGYLAESYRSGFVAIPIGQREAAASLGMSRIVMFRRVVAP